MNTYSHTNHKDIDTGLTLVTLKYENSEQPEKNMQISVAPEYGSNILEFIVGNKDVFYTDKELVKKGLWTGCFVLWPFPNRYDHDGAKAFEFEDQIVSLEGVKRKEGNRPLIHGLVDDKKWNYDQPTVTEDGVYVETYFSVTKDSQLFQFFPFESELRLRFDLKSSGLTVEYTVLNNADKNLPYAFALHPYYTLLDGREHTKVKIPALSVMKATEELLPTGELVSVTGTKYDLTQLQAVNGMMFDDVWTDMQAGQDAYVEYETSGIRIHHKVSPEFTHAVLYTQMEGSLGFICMEPQTGSTNAINLDAKARKLHDEQLKKAAHLLVVPPHETQQGSITFEVEFFGK